MKFENTEVTGFENAILGARLPMCKDLEEAKEKSDSDYICAGVTTKENGEFKVHQGNFHIREKDLDLLKRLINADDKIGQPNSKFLRMIHAQVCITAPLYWWKEMDTYKVGTTANSTSTMHRIANYPITMDCFEMDDFDNYVTVTNNNFDQDCINFIWGDVIRICEELRQKYNELIEQSKKFNEDASEVKDTDKGLYEHFNFEAKKAREQAAKYWKELIRLLPESWLQTRMFDCDYATLRNIYCWRKNHKLTEWHSFCKWVESLPYAAELIIN